MKISESRKKEILAWLDDNARDHDLPYQDAQLNKDAAELIRELSISERSLPRD